MQVVTRHLPWYDEQAVEARHAESAAVIVDAKEAIRRRNLEPSYREADERLGRMAGRSR